MDWCSDDNEKSNGPKKNPLRRSVSTFGFNVGNFTSGIREAKSFTGALQELKPNNNKSMSKQNDPNYYLQMLSEQHKPTKDNEYITKEMSTDTIFVVNTDTLSYRGNQYSLNDIATRWKKDCRMWLWKGDLSRKNRSFSDMKEKIQNLKMSSSFNHKSSFKEPVKSAKLFANKLS